MSCSTPWPIDRRRAAWVLAIHLFWAADAGLAASTGDSASRDRGRPAEVAVDGAGSTMPQDLLPGSRLQGEATLRFFGLRVYHAQLWTQPDFRAERLGEQALVLELRYLRDLQGQAIAERSLEEMRRSSGFSEAQAQGWLAEMRRLFPDVKAGDRLTGRLTPGEGARFWHNGRPVGEVKDTEFARRFFGIWLAPSTSEPAMRQALLGQPG